MKTNKNEKRCEDDNYKVIISELGSNPFRMVKVAFALMGVIPFLVIVYIIIGKNYFYDVFLGSNGFIAIISIFISVLGFFLAYNVVNTMIKKLLSYSYERKSTEEQKTELFLAVTHDLKTPLSVVKVGMKNILDGIAGTVNETQSNIIKVCLNAVEKTVIFINELLNISKVDFIRLDIHRESINFARVVKTELDTIHELASRNDQELKYMNLTRDAQIWADKKKISRAVMNLFSNAVKYTPQGGKIDIKLSDDENTVKLAVANTGSGILPEELTAIFEKNKRLLKHSGMEGAGVGLTIVKEIIDLHKGHLSVKSDPGKETEFEIVLPRDLRAKPRT